MRSMLDELMGKERDVPLEKRSGKGLRYHDPEICKYALAGLCPYGLFKNTKSDLGTALSLLSDDAQVRDASDLADVTIVEGTKSPIYDLF